MGDALAVGPGGVSVADGGGVRVLDGGFEARLTSPSTWAGAAGEEHKNTDQ